MRIESRFASDRARAKSECSAKPSSTARAWVVVRALASCLAVSSLLAAPRASANPLTLVQDGRFVLAEDCSQFGCPGQTVIPPSPFAVWVASVSRVGQRASQSSSVSQTETTATMQGSLATEPDSANPNPDALSLSHFQVTFDADFDAVYALTGDAV